MKNVVSGITEPIPLGPFDLHKRLGRGGMCEVWQGVHRGQQFPVAVKVISKDLARQPRHLRGFREEVRSVAGLSHPSIVMVFDYGQITAEAHQMSGGLLPEDSPYLVMELGGGSMEPLRGKLHWPQLQPIVSSVLDALSHAHAKGVIHRDLKPENILFFEAQQMAKLADFGLAYLWGQDGQELEMEELSGTPAYMAPEQFELRWRDFGPWTDIYALGCTIYSMLTGDAPFKEGKLQALMFAHLMQEPPPLPPDINVPDGFEDWLRKMLAKDPADRFHRAADAAWQLSQLSPPDAPFLNDETVALHVDDLVGMDFLDDDWDETTSPGVSAHITSASHDQINAVYLDQGSMLDAPSAPTINVEAPTIDPEMKRQSNSALPALSVPSWDDDPLGQGDEKTTIMRSPKRPAAEVAPAIAEPGQEEGSEQPPIPDYWVATSDYNTSIALTEVGLGLYGMRAIPLLGRDHEQQKLWTALHQVAEEGTAKFIALTGPAGCGKSRLARSMSEHVHEVGAGIPLKAIHTRLRSKAAGIGPMLSRFLRCGGLDHWETEERLQELAESEWAIDQRDLLALTELMAPAGSEYEEGQTIIRFSLPTERYTAVERYLARLTKRRPVVIWLDDVQWGLDSLQFAQHILKRQHISPLPILFLATAREDALREREVESHCLAELLQSPHAESIQIGPLPAHAHAQLIRELLHLQGELAFEVEERTAGNPLFAVQLVGDWVQRGALECGERGFRLREGCEIEFPDDLHEVWTKRIHQALQNKTSDALRALEIAATMGLEVITEEWLEACQHARVQSTPDLIEILLSQGLAICEDGNIERGWGFVHSMLRESLERWAKEAERWESHNLACALMLQSRRGAGTLERRGRHLLRAGLPRDAVEPLRQGIWERLEAHELYQARQLLDEWMNLLEQLSWPPSHPNWGEGWLLEARYARETGYYDVAKQWAERAIEDARAHRWERIIPRALMLYGYYDWRSGGNHDECWEYMQEAEAQARHQNDIATLQECYRQIGDFLASRGLLEQATKYFQSALKESNASSDPKAMGRSCHGMAMVERQAGNHEAAWRWSERAIEHFQTGGHRRGVADSLNLFGDLARLKGNLEEAERYYRQGIEMSNALGNGNEALFELNLGLVLTERHEYAQARYILERVQVSMARRKRVLFEGAAHISMLPSIAHQQDWQAWQHHVAKAITLLSGAGFYDVDLAKCATLAGHKAREVGALNRAKEAYDLAIEQWENLERAEEAKQLKDIVDAL